MKELTRPWINWASEEAPISVDAVPARIRPPGQPQIRALFDKHKFAQFLEPKIRSGIRQANNARVVARQGMIVGIRSLFRQLIDSRNVNLVSSHKKGISAAAESFMGVPITFFVNREAFKTLGISLTPVNTSVLWKRYRDATGESGFQFTLATGAFRQPGDSYFSFLVPEPAAEDIDLLRQMLERGIATRKFAASLLMVDFPNSVYSPRRNHLLRYLSTVPDTVADGDHAELSGQLATGICTVAEAQPPCADEDPSRCSPEQEFLRYWTSPDDSWKAQFATEIQDYLGKVSVALQSDVGLNQIIRLSISRRHDFGNNVPGAELLESELLFPQSRLHPSPPPLQMTRSGRVEMRTVRIPNTETLHP